MLKVGGGYGRQKHRVGQNRLITTTSSAPYTHREKRETPQTEQRRERRARENTEGGSCRAQRRGRSEEFLHLKRSNKQQRTFLIRTAATGAQAGAQPRDGAEPGRRVAMATPPQWRPCPPRPSSALGGTTPP